MRAATRASTCSARPGEAWVGLSASNLRQWVPADMRVTSENVEQLERLPSGKTAFVIRKMWTPR